MEGPLSRAAISGTPLLAARRDTRAPRRQRNTNLKISIVNSSTTPANLQTNRRSNSINLRNPLTRDQTRLHSKAAPYLTNSSSIRITHPKRHHMGNNKDRQAQDQINLTNKADRLPINLINKGHRQISTAASTTPHLPTPIQDPATTVHHLKVHHKADTQAPQHQASSIRPRRLEHNSDTSREADMGSKAAQGIMDPHQILKDRIRRVRRREDTARVRLKEDMDKVRRRTLGLRNSSIKGGMVDTGVRHSSSMGMLLRSNNLVDHRKDREGMGRVRVGSMIIFDILVLGQNVFMVVVMLFMCKRVNGFP